tara:strand:+ start:2824 stop:4038 length:1215 start_codon:yes stop_codon:yes gene_type:complete
MPAKSKQQQKFMGLVHAFKKGEVPASKVSQAVKDAAKSMTKKSVKKYAKTKHDDLPKKVSEKVNPEIKKIYQLLIKYGNSAKDATAMIKKNLKYVNKTYRNSTPRGKAVALVGLSSLGEVAKRDYKAEYKKFQSSPKMKKYRAELNKYNRKKGTYGNGDGKDASHKGGKIVGFESQSKNRGRAEKSRLKKEGVLKENPAAIAATQAMTKLKLKNPKTGKETSAASALKNKDNPNHKKAKGIFAKLKDRFTKKKDDKPKPKKQSKADADFYKRQFAGEEKLREYIRQEIQKISKSSVNEKMDKRQAGETLKQLGGNKFIMMTGAKNFGVGPKGMGFKIGNNSKKINFIRIDLDRGKDLYNMEFIRLRRKKGEMSPSINVVKKVKGVYADQLQDIFTKYTGMYTRL